MDDSYHAYDISDSVWALLKPCLPGQPGQHGGIAQDNRRFINAVFWVLRTGSPWRALPPDYGKWGTVHQRFIRWRSSGIWERILELLIDEPDFQWLLSAPGGDSIPAPPDVHSNPHGKTDTAARYVWPWMRLVCQSETLLQKIPQRLMERICL